VIASTNGFPHLYVYSLVSMRRATSLALISFFSLLLMAPVFARDPEANLPPCCRRHGAHHCAMGMAERSTGTRGVASLGERCPCFPAATCAAHSSPFEPAAGRQLYSRSGRAFLIPLHSEAGFPLALFGSHQKRGPPLLI
jgi:hypothetical protein